MEQILQRETARRPQTYVAFATILNYAFTMLLHKTCKEIKLITHCNCEHADFYIDKDIENRIETLSQTLTLKPIFFPPDGVNS